MRFTFEVAPRGGLRIIPTIEDYPLCRLEGRNGIGKTLAVHLLEIATGSQPYSANPLAWRSLKDSLGPTHITVTGLQAGNVLDIHLTPHQWPDQPLTTIEALRTLGTARLNNVAIDLPDVREELRVFRISGDETLAGRLRSYIAQDKARVERYNQRFSQQYNGALDTFAGLRHTPRDLTLRAWEALDLRAEQAIAQRTMAQSQLEEITDVVACHDQLAYLRASLQRLREEGSEIVTQLDTIKGEIAAQTQERATLEDRRQHLHPRVERAQEANAQLQHLIEQRTKTEQRLRDALLEASTALDPLGLPLDENALDEEILRTKNEREALRQREGEVAFPPELLKTITSMKEAPAAEQVVHLAHEVVAVLDDDRQISLQQQRAGFDRRAEQLVLRQPALQDIRARGTQMDERINRLQHASRLLTTVTRVTKNLSTIDGKIRITSDLQEASNEYQDVVFRLGTLDTMLHDLIRRQAVLEHQHRMLEREGTEADVVTRIEALERELSSTTVSFSDPNDARARKANLEHMQEEAASMLDQATRERASFETALAACIRELLQRPQYSWMHVHFPPSLPITIDTVRVWDRFQTQVGALQQTLNLLGNRTPAVMGNLDQLIREMGTMPDGQSEERIDPSLSALMVYYQRAFGELLASDEFQQTLFDGGRLEDLDLRTASLTWQTQDGEQRRRPIEAFSAGEQAFAYVLASVLRSAKEEARNRVLVLDEFGAFLEADRLMRLTHFLQRTVLQEKRADQVIIILPLQQARDTAEEAAVQQHGYFMRAISE